MTTVADPASPGDKVIEQPTEVLIREARRRQRHRRLGVSGIVLLLGAASLIVARATASSSGRSGHPARPPAATVPAQPSGPVQPITPTLTAGEFSGTWRVHTTSITIGADGIGTATWPGAVAAGESEATAVPNGAQLRLTSVEGKQADGIVFGSTDPAQLPNGPVQLQITDEDLLQVTPSQPVADMPLRWTGLCGSSALSLTLAEQIAEGINCGA